MKNYAHAESISGKKIRQIRTRLGISRRELANLCNVSLNTIERWENSKENISGMTAAFFKIIEFFPQICEKMEIPETKYPLRLWFLDGDDPCTVIDVDDKIKAVRIKNYTNDYLKCAFGKNVEPSYEDYEEFLESRCFPRTGDKMKIRLEELGLPFYDPMLIIEKTEGKVAEDNFRIVIER